MSESFTVDMTAPFIIGATGEEEIRQNMRVIVLSTAWSVPFDRGFAHTGAFIDAPAPYEAARLISALMEAIETREPRVRVRKIIMEADSRSMGEGRLRPRIIYDYREGVLL